MKFYTSPAPNPRIVHMFAHERGIELETEMVNLRGGDNRRGPYLEINPFGQMPALALDNGDVITEVAAICEYLDEISDGESLYGDTPEARAQTRRWLRWADLNVIEPILNGFRFGEGLDFFKDRVHCIPQASDDLKTVGRKNMALLDKQLEGNDYITGDKMTQADVHIFCMLDFAIKIGQPIDEAYGNVIAWHERMKARESAEATK